jgi:hypothetical protein
MRCKTVLNFVPLLFKYDVHNILGTASDTLTNCSLGVKMFIRTTGHIRKPIMTFKIKTLHDQHEQRN